MSADPITLALVGLNAASSISNASTQKNVANQQAEHAAQEAQRQRQVAKINAGRIADQNRKVRSRAFAQQTAGGADPSSGSALLVQQDLAAEDSLEQAMAIFDGELKSQDLEHQARLKRYSAKGLMSQAAFNTGTSLLSQFEDQSKFDFRTGKLSFV